MDWVQSLNKAIDYIEDNLLINLPCGKVAEHVYFSTSHFQRTFYLLTGFTVGEYIRNRRLTLAGQDLTITGAKVIDVAMKYGYDTPESFSKAFTRFHNITPIQAKKEEVNLKSFNRLTIKIIMEGGCVMDYKIVTKEAFNVVVKVAIFNEENSTQAIPAFWNEYFSSGLHNKVNGTMGICGEIISNGAEFKYGIGCLEKDVKELPDGFERWTIPTRTWAVFKCVGPMPNAIQHMWKRIYSEWLPQAKYELIPGYDFENYTEGDNNAKEYISEIWIPVKEKE